MKVFFYKEQDTNHVIIMNNNMNIRPSHGFV